MDRRRLDDLDQTRGHARAFKVDFPKITACSGALSSLNPTHSVSGVIRLSDSVTVRDGAVSKAHPTELTQVWGNAMVGVSLLYWCRQIPSTLRPLVDDMLTGAPSRAPASAPHETRCLFKSRGSRHNARHLVFVAIAFLASAGLNETKEEKVR